MRQIFDWLRNEICKGSECINERYYTTVVHSLSCVNEAEAKWETECCEWKREESYPYRHLTNCGRMITHKHKEAKFCCFCGKPIKISEVE